MTKPKNTDKQTIKELERALNDMRAELDKYSQENRRLQDIIKEREEVIKEWNDDWKKSQAKRHALLKMLGIIKTATTHADELLN